MAGAGQLVRRLRQVPADDEVTPAERAALSRLLHSGPATSAELARAERISPQSMGVTLAALESRGYFTRGRDPEDGRRVVFSFTDQGRQFVRNSRNARAEVVARALADGFTAAEIDQLRAAAPLLQRLALDI